MPISIFCVVCGKERLIKPSSIKRIKTCSKDCSDRYASIRADGVQFGTSEIRSCVMCGQNFKIWKSTLEKRAGLTCSPDCGNKYRISKIDNDLIKEKYLSGLSIYEIGKLVGAAGATVGVRLKKMGVEKRSMSENSKGANNGMYGRGHTDEAKEKIRQANIKQFSNPENREKHAVITAKQIESGRTGKKNNSLEKKVSDLLSSLDVVFCSQYRVGRHVFDFYIQSKNLLIEADGTFWHSDSRFYPNKELLSNTQKHNMLNDAKKNDLAKTNGFTLLRIKEFDVDNNYSEVLNVIKQAIKP